jgi:hypothetical protein
MSIDEIVDLFSDKPFKMTSVHRSILTRMIAVCRAAEEWAEDTDDAEFAESLTDSITDLLEYDD